MANKVEKNKQTNKFHPITGGSDLSAGICGPDGCVLDWSKADKEKKKETKDE